MAIALTADERSLLDAKIAVLQAQLNDDADTQGGGARKDHTTLLVIATIALAFLAVAAIVVIFIVRPDKDNTSLVTTLISILVPLMTALMAAAIQQVHMAVDGRLTQLLRITAEKNRAEGVIAGQNSSKSDDQRPVATTELP